MDKELQTALSNLDAVCAKYQGTRDEHVQLTHDLGIIKKALEGEKKEEEPKAK